MDFCRRAKPERLNHGENNDRDRSEIFIGGGKAVAMMSEPGAMCLQTYYDSRCHAYPLMRPMCAREHNMKRDAIEISSNQLYEELLTLRKS